MTSRAAVLGALSGVRDPELDESLTELDFVADLEIEGDSVLVHLRLPTYFCSPNFAYLMVSDAKAALMAIPGVRKATVVLDDHHASEEINEGIAEDKQFQEIYPTQTLGGLDDLRDLFRRKAFIARQEELHGELVSSGRSREEVAGMLLRDLPPSAETDRYLDRREELGLDISPEAPFMIDAAGRPIPEDAMSQHLRFARMVSINIEGNAGLCRGLLATRYGLPKQEEVATR
jgi:metal-sulfur cluster biosynthetic enzyme